MPCWPMTMSVAISTIKMRALVCVLALWASPAMAVSCEDVSFLEHSFVICSVDVDQSDLRLFHTDQTGDIIGSFDRLAAEAPARHLSFAMNAGMYHADRSPVGLFQKDGVTLSALVTTDGPGNFGLLPNGVLCLNDTSARVIETLAFVASGATCRDANQSGPMLVIDGALHPRFLPNGTSEHIRNGVGTFADGKTAVFAISNDPVNFYTFGLFFRDYLQTPNALYLDGSISRLYAPQLGRADLGFQLGPMLGVFE